MIRVRHLAWRQWKNDVSKDTVNHGGGNLNSAKALFHYDVTKKLYFIAGYSTDGAFNLFAKLLRINSEIRIFLKSYCDVRYFTSQGAIWRQNTDRRCTMQVQCSKNKIIIMFKFFVFKNFWVWRDQSETNRWSPQASKASLKLSQFENYPEFKWFFFFQI